MASLRSVRTGADLVQHIQGVEPDFNVPQLLTDYFQLDDIVAQEIANLTHEAKVIPTPNGAFAMDSTTVRNEDQSEVTSLNDIYFPHIGSIVLNMAMMSTVQDTLTRGLGLPTKRIQEIAMRSVAAFEVGRFASREVYRVIMRNFHTSGLSVPNSDEEGLNFFANLSDELASRGLNIDWKPSDYTPQIAGVYNREVRPEQFLSRGGLETLSTVIPGLDGDRLIDRFRDRILDQDMPPLPEMGALMPMSVACFKQLCSYVLDPAADVIIPFQPEPPKS